MPERTWPRKTAMVKQKKRTHKHKVPPLLHRNALQGLISGPDLLRWADDYGVKLTTGDKAEKGDIVVCSQTKNWCSPEQLGIIRAAHTKKPMKLTNKGGRPHPDGDEANLFVQPYSKIRYAKKNLSRKCLLVLYFCLYFYRLLVIFYFVLTLFNSILPNWITANQNCLLEQSKLVGGYLRRRSCSPRRGMFWATTLSNPLPIMEIPIVSTKTLINSGKIGRALSSEPVRKAYISLTRSLTHSLTHSLTRSLTHSPLTHIDMNAYHQHISF